MKRKKITPDQILAIMNKHLEMIKTRYAVRRIGLFGSHARMKAKSDSDVDILVELEHPTFDNFMDLKFFLEDLFQREVDLVLSDTLKPRIKPHILKEVRYAEGL